MDNIIPTRISKYLEGLEKIKNFYNMPRNDDLFCSYVWSNESRVNEDQKYHHDDKYIVSSNDIEEVIFLENFLKNPANHYEIFPNYSWVHVASDCEQIREIKNPIKLDFKGFLYTFIVKEEIIATDNFKNKYYSNSNIFELAKFDFPLEMNDLFESDILDYVNDKNDMFTGEIYADKCAIYVFEVIENNFDKKYILVPGFNGRRDINKTCFVCGTNELPKLDYVPKDTLQLYFNYAELYYDDKNHIVYNFFDDEENIPQLNTTQVLIYDYFKVIIDNYNSLISYISYPIIENYRQLNYVKRAIK